MIQSKLLSLTFALLIFTASAFAETPAPSAEPAQATNDGLFIVSALGGVSSYSTSGPTGAEFSQTTSQLDYGVRFGINALLGLGTAQQLSDLSKIYFGISVDRFYTSHVSAIVNSAGVTVFGHEVSTAYLSFLGQAIARNIYGTGAYFGPELGVTLNTFKDITTNVSTTASLFTLGAAAGWDFWLSPNLSIGPEAHYDHYGAGSKNGLSFPTASSTKFLLNVSYHI